MNKKRKIYRIGLIVCFILVFTLFNFPICVNNADGGVVSYALAPSDSRTVEIEGKEVTLYKYHKDTPGKLGENFCINVWDVGFSANEVAELLKSETLENAIITRSEIKVDNRSPTVVSVDLSRVVIDYSSVQAKENLDGYVCTIYVSSIKDDKKILTECLNIRLVVVGEEMIIPTVTPTSEPIATPTVKPTQKPTPKPTTKPTPKPTRVPTIRPTVSPTPYVNDWYDDYYNDIEKEDDGFVEENKEPTVAPIPTVRPTPEPTITIEPTTEPDRTEDIGGTEDSTKEKREKKEKKVPIVVVLGVGAESVLILSLVLSIFSDIRVLKWLKTGNK